MKTLMFFYAASGLLLAVIALPLMARKIKPNPFYGLRIRETLDDPELWYEANQFFGRHLFVVGLIQSSASIALYFIRGLGVDAYALFCLGIFIVLFTFVLYKSWQFIRSSKQNVPRT